MTVNTIVLDELRRVVEDSEVNGKLSLITKIVCHFIRLCRKMTNYGLYLIELDVK